MLESVHNEIHFHFEDVEEINLSEYLKDWLQQTAEKEGKSIGEINYILCDDEYLLKINQQYLQHDTLTDIITFDYCEGDVLNSDIFISTERVNDNSKSLKNNFLDEFERVCVHGILHLSGFKDKTEEDALLMRQKEDFYLNLRPI
jgi:rRNA maturation RNase YbeY